MHRMHKLGLVVFALTVPLIACDSDEAIVIGVERYVAPLASVNAPLGVVSGTATIDIVGDQMRVTVSATGLDPVMHMQFVGSGSACPTLADNANQDGVIDLTEGMTAFGPFLLALDNTLAVRFDTIPDFPTGPTISYVETERYSAVENSMRGAPVTQFTTNIPINGDFIPAGYTVVILGDSSPIPTQLPVLPGFNASQSIPVACGVISRVLN